MRSCTLCFGLWLAASVAPANAELKLGTMTGSGAPSGASFSGGASSGNGATKTAFAEDTAFSVEIDISVDPQHRGQTGSIFVLGTVGGALFQRLSNGAWASWNGDFDLLQPTVGPRTLNAQEDVFVFSSPGGVFPGANIQALVAYASNDNDFQYNWPPVPIAIAGRCDTRPGDGSLIIDANNAVLVAEVVYRLINALSDTSSLIDQTSREVATTGIGAIPCTVAGFIESSVSNASQPGKLDPGEQIFNSLSSCTLGDSVVMDGDALFVSTRTTGAVSNNFGEAWSCKGNVSFQDFVHIRGTSRFRLEGDYEIASQNFATTGIQTIDFNSTALDVYYNGFLLGVSELCHESNAFGGSQQQSESFSFRLDAGPLGQLMVYSVEPFGGSFGGPSTFGRMGIFGGGGSSVTIDANECGSLALDVTGRGVGGRVVTPEPNCISFASFQD